MTENTQSVPDNTGAQQSDDSVTEDRGGSRAPIPPPFSMDANSLQFSDEHEAHNYLFGGIGASAAYADNLLAESAVQVGGASYSINPTVGIEIARPRLKLNTDYEGGYTFNQRFSQYDQAEHNAQFDLQYRLTRHVTMRLHNYFVLTTGFFNDIPGSLGDLGSGVVQQPNLGVITPIVSRTFDLGSGELTYQYSANDMIGGSADVYISSFGNTPAGAQSLVDSRSEGANAFYTHRFTPRNWSGIAYTFQRITFDPVIEGVDSHDILLFHTVYLTRHTSVSFFAGPEYTQLNQQIVTAQVSIPQVTVNSTTLSQDRWAVAGGANLNWQGRHTSLSLSGARKVNDGAGILAASDVTSGTGAIRRKLSRSSNLEMDVAYNGNRALGGGTAFFTSSKAVWASLFWQNYIGKHFVCTLGYAHNYLQQTGLSVPTVGIHQNRGWVSFGYRFTRPLGR